MGHLSGATAGHAQNGNCRFALTRSDLDLLVPAEQLADATVVNPTLDLWSKLATFPADMISNLFFSHSKLDHPSSAFCSILLPKCLRSGPKKRGKALAAASSCFSSRYFSAAVVLLVLGRGKPWEESLKAFKCVLGYQLLYFVYGPLREDIKPLHQQSSRLASSRPSPSSRSTRSEAA